jgi:4-carboxymuconolactone decarboxylase
MTLRAAVSASHNEVRTVAPRPTLTETLVHPDTWERPGLSKRDRSLITAAALMARYRPDHLKGHTERALANRVTRAEIGELITHLAFYAGWPSAMSSAKVVEHVLEEKRA